MVTFDQVLVFLVDGFIINVITYAIRIELEARLRAVSQIFNPIQSETLALSTLFVSLMKVREL